MDEVAVPLPDMTVDIECAQAGLEYCFAVDRLGTLTPAEYDRVRKIEAKRHGIRVSTHIGDQVTLECEDQAPRQLRLAFSPLNLGRGQYVFSVALYRRLSQSGESASAPS